MCFSGTPKTFDWTSRLGQPHDKIMEENDRQEMVPNYCLILYI